jgi:hypothetical protein
MIIKDNAENHNENYSIDCNSNNNAWNLNEHVEVYVDNVNTDKGVLSGWIDGRITNMKGDFLLVDYYLNDHFSKLVHKNSIRKKKEDEKVIELKLKNCFSVNVDFIKNVKQGRSKKIHSLIKHLKSLINEINYAFYSIACENIFIFGIKDKDPQLEFLIREMIETAKEHYVYIIL